MIVIEIQIFASFTKTRDPVKALPGPLPRPWKDPERVWEGAQPLEMKEVRRRGITEAGPQGQGLWHN